MAEAKRFTGDEERLSLQAGDTPGHVASAVPALPPRWATIGLFVIALFYTFYFAAPVLIGYAAIAVAIPLHLGLTYAVPGGIRWVLLVAVWAGFAILAVAFSARHLPSKANCCVKGVSFDD